MLGNCKCPNSIISILAFMVVVSLSSVAVADRDSVAAASRDSSAPRRSLVAQGPTTCAIPRRDNLACAGAGLWSVVDPGCSASCQAPLRAICRESTCIGNTWTQSICFCGN